MKFSGSNWVAVGSAGFSDGVADYLSLAFDSNDTPYVVYGDFANSSKAIVKKFDRNNWITIGRAGFLSEGVGFITLALDNNCTPYVVYKDEANSYKVTVMKYYGINWVNIKSAGVFGSLADYTSIAIGKKGNLFIIYKDCSNSEKVPVKRYDGNSWINIGNTGFSKGKVSYTDIAKDSDDIPYFLFIDFGYFLKASMMRFSSDPLSVEENNIIPGRITLNQNYPNPFNPSTTINFIIPYSEFVTLKVYDLLGREVAIFVNENVSAGKYTYNFDASNSTCGVYFYKLQAGKESEVKKMMSVKQIT